MMAVHVKLTKYCHVGIRDSSVAFADEPVQSQFEGACKIRAAASDETSQAAGNQANSYDDIRDLGLHSRL
jgi:hypothetical protein